MRSFYRQNKEELVIKRTVSGALLGKFILKVGGLRISIQELLMLMMTVEPR